MSYQEVKSRIREAYTKYSKPISVKMISQDINTTERVARKALEMLCKEGFCKSIGREEYKVISS